MSIRSMAQATVLASLLLASCSGQEEASGSATPAPEPAPAVETPALHEGPLTQDAAVGLFDGLPMDCKPIASLKYEMHQCDVKRGVAEGDAPLVESLRSMHAELAALSPADAQARCGVLYAELQATPKPRACW
ncbi:hypothetical protein [Brevundimonas sp. A19_0]|uniref:hypothetical protein n=1 Tax=Brevundimonas sp. A19_0 TaxID=2821087 RepID=UPI001AD9CC4E|nr:hypothetical protein [Brevundimonas sp. A19_0]MBO9502466.1 hypothetical protein [Brevundimonas sp. A19_0]